MHLKQVQNTSVALQNIDTEGVVNRRCCASAIMVIGGGGHEFYVITSGYEREDVVGELSDL